MSFSDKNRQKESKAEKMNETKDRIKKCPTCNAAPVLVREVLYMWGQIPTRPRYYYRCEQCGRRGLSSFTGRHGITGETRSDDDARRWAARHWNGAAQGTVETTAAQPIEVHEIAGEMRQSEYYQPPSPCPVCGSGGVYVRASVWRERSCAEVRYYIRCAHCHHQAPAAILRGDDVNRARRCALESWNAATCKRA